MAESPVFIYDTIHRLMGRRVYLDSEGSWSQTNLEHLLNWAQSGGIGDRRVVCLKKVISGLEWVGSLTDRIGSTKIALS